MTMRERLRCDDALDAARSGIRRPRKRPLGRSLLRAAVACMLGVAIALLASCGSSGKGLIPAADAGPLRSDFEAIATAARDGSGSCAATETAIRQTERDFSALPATLDSGLRERLQSGIKNLRERALEMCAQPAAPTTATSTSPSTGGTQTTSTTPTVTQTTTTETTPPATTTTPPSTGTGGGTPAPRENEGGSAPGGNQGGTSVPSPGAREGNSSPGGRESGGGGAGGQEGGK
jgi:hypothetical protein